MKLRSDRYPRTVEPASPDTWSWWLDNHIASDVHNMARRVGVDGPVVELTLEAMQRLADDLRTYREADE